MAKSEKLDLYRQHKAEYAASKSTAAVVTVGQAKYLAIQGQGEPGGDVFTAAVGGIYGAAFTIKMTRKFAGKGDYKIAPLEGLWWGDADSKTDFLNLPRSQWRWKLLIRTPDAVAQSDLDAAKDALRAKGKPPQFEDVMLESIEEGRCVQMLHVGPYAAEAGTLAAMEQFAADSGLEVHGLHHEIYLSDPRRTAPEKLRTILRLPVRRKESETGA